MSVPSANTSDLAAATAREMAALRRVARIAARGASATEFFEAAAQQIAEALDVPSLSIDRYQPGPAITVVAALNAPTFRPGESLPLDGPCLAAIVLETGQPARIDDYSELPGAIAASTREAGIRSAAGAPITVDGVTWGMAWIATTDDEPLPAGIEDRLHAFTELAGIAVSNAEERDRRRALADEQAALRGVATLVARESSPVEIFAAVTAEARRVLESEAVGLLRFEADGVATLVAQSETPWEPPPLGTRLTLDGENVVAEVSRTGRVARADDWSEATGAVAALATVLGVRSAVATPVIVEGRLWGTLIAATSRAEALPGDTERRIAQFTALVATAIANAEARGGLARLAEEQAALRRVAVLVAEQPSPDEVFTAVTAAVGPLLGADLSAMHVFHEDGTARAIAGWSDGGPMVPIGTVLPLDGDSAVARVFRTGAAARIDSYVGAEGGTAAVARGLQLRSTVGAPIVVDGELWGALMAATRGEEPLPGDAETRIAAFTELVATAVSNTQARADLQRLADEQAGLRKVATLVASGSSPEDVFRAVASEVAVLFGSDVSAIVRFDDDGMATVLGDVGGPHRAGKRVSLDPGYVVHQVRETGRSARFDTSAPVDTEAGSLVGSLGIRSAVASPILVDGALWGAVTVASLEGRLAAGAERRLTDFTELVATAVANTQTREQITALADEQAALRRVATLVARDASPEEVFDAVAAEVGDLLGATVTVLTRYDGDGSATAIARWGSSPEQLPVGTRSQLGGRNLLTSVYETGAPARLDSYRDADGESAEIANRLGWRSSIAAPVTVENRVWGVMLVATQREDDPFPDGAEHRLAAFTELMGTAVANAEAHVAVRTFADEQAALRRVATLVAASAEPLDLFGAVSEEIGLVLGADATMLCRADVDGAAVVVGTRAEIAPPVGTRIPRGGTNLTTIVLETGRPARIDGYGDATGAGAEVARSYGLRSAVGAPIHVDGRVWGVVIAGTTTDEPLRADAGDRLAAFSELVATAIANAQSQDDLKGLADQQAALRRVATLVARRTPPDEVFRAVADETGALLSTEMSVLVRLEDDDTVTMLAGTHTGPAATGERLAIDPRFVMHAVRETRRPARFETDDPTAESNPPVVRETSLRSAVASPIIVDGILWGAAIVASTEALPADTEQRLDGFTELAATAISNATTRAELVASRARLVTAGDEALRRVERDLHDGAQQRLLAIGLDLQRVRAQLPADQAEARAELERVGDDLEAVGEEIRELSRGLHPAQLSRSGLGPALRALARRSPIEVDLRVEVDDRPAEPIETAVYFVVSEAVANAIKHSGASTISITVLRDGAQMLATVSDDGIGGAAPGRGSGLTGLRDRVEALGGRFALGGPPGTTISVELPVTAP